MTFVPVVTNPPAPSPRANELGRRLTETIDRFREEDPSVSPSEVRQALMLARPRDGSDRSSIAAALVAVFLVFGLVMFLYFTQAGAALGGPPLTLFALIGFGIVALAIVSAKLKNR